MARQTSKGTCTFCRGEFSKSAMTRHLETCEQRASAEAKAGNRRTAQKIRTHLAGYLLAFSRPALSVLTILNVAFWGVIDRYSIDKHRIEDLQ
jgi:hypothetical protein